MRGARRSCWRPRQARCRRSTTWTRRTRSRCSTRSSRSARTTTTRWGCPAGWAHPTNLRTLPAAVKFLQALVAACKPVAVICHGPWTLVEADVVRGRTLTSWPSLQTDIRNAGGSWVDEAVVSCTKGPNTLITSRKPDDLDAFCSELVRVFV